MRSGRKSLSLIYLSKKMDPAYILSQATGAWLQYEFACGRATLFNERYMSVPIANALFTIYKQEVRSEFLHPVLAAAMTGPGRRPEVDFAVINSYPNLSCVVESKWLGGSGLPMEEILWDLLRLELVAHYAKVPAFFLLGGRRRHLEQFFKSRTFLGKPNRKGKFRKLLKLHHEGQSRIRVDSPTQDRKEVFQRLLRPYQNLSFSSFVTTSSSYSYPHPCASWRCLGAGQRSDGPPTQSEPCCFLGGRGTYGVSAFFVCGRCATLLGGWLTLNPHYTQNP